MHYQLQKFENQVEMRLLNAWGKAVVLASISCIQLITMAGKMLLI